MRIAHLGELRFWLVGERVLGGAARGGGLSLRAVSSASRLAR